MGHRDPGRDPWRTAQRDLWHVGPAVKRRHGKSARGGVSCGESGREILARDLRSGGMAWPRPIATCVAVAIGLVSFPAGATADSSDRSRSASSRGDRGCVRRGHPHRDHAYEKAVGALVAYIVLSPWLVPRLATRKSHVTGFSDYPYDRGGDSRMVDARRDDSSTHDYALRLGVDGTLFNRGGGAALEAQLDLRFPVAFKLRARALHEAADGLQLEQDRWAGLTELDVLYRFAQSRHVSFYTGVGYAQWNDRLGLVPGGVLFYGFEVYPVQPLSLGSQVSAGVLGQSYVVQWRSYLGLLAGRVETQLGFDYINVGGEKFLGPMVGLQFHL